MNIKRIKAPTFRVGRNILNEYELYQLLVDIASGIIALDKKLKIKDVLTGEVAYVDQKSNLSHPLSSMQILSNMKFDRLRKANNLP